MRTALGVATLTFYTVLTFAASTDVLATTFGLSVNFVLRSFRVLLIVLPPITGRVTYVLCRELAARDAPLTGAGEPSTDEPPVDEGTRSGGRAAARRRPLVRWR